MNDKETSYQGAQSAADPYRENQADQADIIDMERLRRWLVAYGISTDESLEAFAARFGEAVNILTCREPFSSSAQPAASAEPFKLRWSWYSDTEGSWEVIDSPRYGGLQEGEEITVYAAHLAAQPSVPPLNMPAIEAFVDEYLDEYELRLDDGCHAPTEAEQFLIADAINGLLADDEFMALLRPTPPASTQKGQP